MHRAEDRTLNVDQTVTLFICSGCEQCNPALPRFREWATRHPGVDLEISRVLHDPERIVRLGISCAPAVVVDGELLIQDASPDALIETLERYLQRKDDTDGTG